MPPINPFADECAERFSDMPGLSQAVDALEAGGYRIHSIRITDETPRARVQRDYRNRESCSRCGWMPHTDWPDGFLCTAGAPLAADALCSACCKESQLECEHQSCR